MSRDFLNAVKEGDIHYVSDNVDNMDEDTLKKALSLIKNTIRNFKSKGSDYSSDKNNLEIIQSIIEGRR